MGICECKMLCSPTGSLITFLSHPSDGTRWGVNTSTTTGADTGHAYAHQATCTVVATRQRGCQDFEFVGAEKLQRFLLIVQLYVAVYTFKIWAYTSCLRYLAPPYYTAADVSLGLMVYVVGLLCGSLLLGFLVIVIVSENVGPAGGWRSRKDDDDDEAVAEEEHDATWLKNYSVLQFHTGLTAAVAQTLFFLPTAATEEEQRQGGMRAPTYHTMEGDTIVLPPDPDRPMSWQDQRNSSTLRFIVLAMWLPLGLMCYVDWLVYYNDATNTAYTGFFWISFVAGTIATIAVPWFYVQITVVKLLEKGARESQESMYSNFIYD
jgi:hypothetical protein